MATAYKPKNYSNLSPDELAMHIKRIEDWVDKQRNMDAVSKNKHYQEHVEPLAKRRIFLLEEAGETVH